MKTFIARKWIDETVSVIQTNQKNYYPKSYYLNAKEIFIEDQNCMGLALEEAEDIFNETPFPQIEKFLKKSGYDLGGNNYE
jgi:hypothetical protein